METKLKILWAVAHPRLVSLLKISAAGRYPAKPNKHMTRTEAATADTKQWRKDLDEVLQRIKNQSGLNTKCDSSSSRESYERSLAVMKIQEAIMWLGMDLKGIGETPNPYPHSYDPASPVIEPTADGLRL